MCLLTIRYVKTTHKHSTARSTAIYIYMVAGRSNRFTCKRQESKEGGTKSKSFFVEEAIAHGSLEEAMLMLVLSIHTVGACSEDGRMLPRQLKRLWQFTKMLPCESPQKRTGRLVQHNSCGVTKAQDGAYRRVDASSSRGGAS